MDLEYTVKRSNFIGDTIDMAYEFKLSSLLLVGHMGKLVKLGCGIMNTHSAYADGRMETMVQLMKKIDSALKKCACDGLFIEAIVFSNKYGVLGMTTGAEGGAVQRYRQRI